MTENELAAIRERNGELAAWLRLPYAPPSLPPLVDTVADIDALLRQVGLLREQLRAICYADPPGREHLAALQRHLDLEKWIPDE